MLNPRSKTIAIFHAPLLVAVSVMGDGCRSQPGPATQSATDPSHFVDGMNAYLEKRGDLCLARSVWPVDVTPEDVAAGTRDAVQMPALEGVKVVASSILPSGVTRYRLTDLGRRHFIDRGTRRPAQSEGSVLSTADFCVARLRLDQIKGIELERVVNRGARAVIMYSYLVEAPAWTRDPAVRRAFPAVDRVISGAGSATLREVLTQTSAGWVASELLPSADAAQGVTVAGRGP